jgi:diguanylate cyclase (GGDEF)-like protein
MTVPLSPFDRRRDRIRRWKEERDVELTDENTQLERHQRAQTELLAGFPPTDVPPPRERSLGPTPREGMRPSRREAPTAPGDPYAEDSQLARAIGQARYQSPLTPFLKLGQTEARVMRSAYGLAGHIPVIGKPFRALEEDLDSRIRADEASENVVRTKHMSPVERGAQDLAAFAVEFETGTRALGPLGSILRTPATAYRAAEGAGMATRLAAGARRIGTRAAVDAAQFGTWESGKSLATGESIDEAAQHGREGALAGAVFGGGFGAAGEALPVAGRILRPVAEGAAAVPGAIRQGVSNTARDALVADAMIRESAGRLRERFSGATGRLRRGLAERLSPELAEEASKDPLTGALNRRADAAATEAIVTKREPGTRVIRLRADLDNFKALNDTHGHEAGDQALQRVTEAWRQAAREGDVIDSPGTARLGGDEFGATLRIGEHADPDAIARRYEQRANEALAEAGLHQAGDKQVGISVGWAEHGAGNAQELDAAADQAAAARKKGRGVSKPREGTSAPERIHAVAIREADGTVVAGKPGQIHGELAGLGDHAPDGEEGFVTTTGRFVGREEAATIAREAGQLSKPGADALAARKSGGLDAIDMPEVPTGQPAPPSRAPDARPPEQGPRDTSGGEIVPPEAPQAPASVAEAPSRAPAAPGQLQRAFAERLERQQREDPGWMKRAGEDLQSLTGLDAALESTGFKAQPSEFHERFRSLLSHLPNEAGSRADKPVEEYVRVLDERLSKAGTQRYEVSRYKNDRLPDDFDTARWGEKGVPRPERLRDETGWGEHVNRVFRSLESASDRANRDADMLEALGAPKDAPGVTAARQAANGYAIQKVMVEQQAEHAVALAERYHSMTAVHRAASLNRDISKVKIKPSDWVGNSMVEGEWVSDGHMMFRRSDLDAHQAKRAPQYLKESESRKGIGQQGAVQVFTKAVAEADTKLELLGHLPAGGTGSGSAYQSAYLVPEGATTGLRRVNAALLRRLQEITKYDELRGAGKGKKVDELPIVGYRAGEPVGVLMPIRLPDEQPFSIEQARRLAGASVAPPKRGGTTKVAGLTVREPLTARTPMEPNFEEPLQSASLPAAAQPSMSPTGGALAAERSRIVRKMAEVLDIPVRIGKYAGFKRGTLGIYKVRPEAIRLKVAKDIEVLGHEIGHHIHKLFFGGSRGLSGNALRTWWKELKPLGKGISDQSSSEGLAEFFRRYLTNPAEAKSAAPTFFEYVEKRLAQDFPEVRSMFEEARAAYKTYIDASPEARVASNISTQPTKSWSFPDKVRRFMAGVVDDMYDVEKAQQDIISSALGLDAPPRWRVFARAKWMAEVQRQTRWEENAASLAHLVRGSAGTAEHFIKRGTLDFATLQVKGKGLEAILRPVGPQFEEFLHYSVSRRAMELHGRNVETGILPADATAVVQKYASREHFDRAFGELQIYQRQLLEWLRDAGVVSPDTFKRVLEKNEHYLPFYRVLDEEAAKRAGGGSVFGKLFSPVKRIKGSGRDIINPFESIIKNTYLYTRLAARQRVSQALAKLAERDGAGVWIERLPVPTAVTKFSFGEIQGQLRDILGDHLNLEDVTPEQAELLAQEMLAIYRPGDYFGKDNIISTLRGNKRAWYEVDPDLYKAMMGLSTEQAGTMTRLLTFPAKALRVGATLSLEFIGRNPIRDQLAAFVQSDYGFKPGFDWGRGLFHMLKRDDLFWKWKAAGGERAALLELDRDSLKKSVRDVLGRAPGAGEIVKDVIKSPIELLKLLSAAAEDATRIGEFARGVEREGTSRAGFEKAATASREVSVDFARHGAKTEAIRMMTAFWNARLQGYHRLYRAMRDHPVRTSYRAGVAITLPSVLLFYANKDDPEYWAKPQWERDLFWHVKIRGTYYKIPKPFELGVIFGTIPERLLEWAHTNDPKGVESALGTLANDASGLIPIPTTLVPLIENFGNWSLFKRQPIESRTLEDVQPEYRFTEGTSEVGKGLGRMLGQSPMKIDNLMFGWSGGLGRMAVDLGDIAGQQTGLFPDEPRPSKTAADIPGVRGFVSKSAGRGSEDVERFYSAWSDAREAKATRDLLDREERIEELDAFEDKNADALDRYDELKSYADELARLRHEIAELSRDESLSPDQRRREVEALGREMQQVAAEGIERRTPAGRP